MLGMMALLLSDNGGATFKADALKILFWIFTIVDALLVGYAVYIAFLFATATDAAKRTAAKSRLIKVFSSLLCIIALTMTLKAIDINFDPLQGNLSNNKPIFKDQSDLSLIYTGAVDLIEITEDASQNFSIKLNADGFETLSGKKIDKQELVFLDVEFSEVFEFKLPQLEVQPDGSALIKFQVSAGRAGGGGKSTITGYTSTDGKTGSYANKHGYVKGEISISYTGVPKTVVFFAPIKLTSARFTYRPGSGTVEAVNMYFELFTKAKVPDYVVPYAF